MSQLHVGVLLGLIGLAACSTADTEETGVATQAACNCDAHPQPCCCTTPILLDIAGDGIHLTSWQDGVVFNLLPWRGPGLRAWTEPGSDDAWLFLDTDDDGLVTDGTELFGDMTLQPEPLPGQSKNGFLALAQYDGNGDKAIDNKDKVFNELRLWQDKDHDGISQPDELHPLPDLGVTGISVEHSEIHQPDGLGNVLRYSAPVYGTVGMTAWDVMLASPMRAEREAYGLPDPQPLDDPQPTSEDDLPAPPPLPPGRALSSAALACLYTVHLAIPYLDPFATTFGYWKAAGFVEALAPPPLACSPYDQKEVTVRLYNRYQSSWRAVSTPVAIVGPRVRVYAARACQWTHTTAWFSRVWVKSLDGFDIPGSPDDSLPSLLNCSSFAPPSPPPC